MEKNLKKLKEKEGAIENKEKENIKRGYLNC